MPIQFRCGSCQQLLGIAKRKAGSIVDCPTCAHRTLVPPTSSGDSELTEPPVRRERTQPQSIFDRVDVDKLLQKPTKPILVESESEGGIAVAPPPVRRKVVFTPDPLEEQVKVQDEPQALHRLETNEAEPVSDEPFALTPMPTLTASRSKNTTVWLSLYLVMGGLLVLGAFFAGHWVGTHRPLF